MGAVLKRENTLNILWEELIHPLRIQNIKLQLKFSEIFKISKIRRYPFRRYPLIVDNSQKNIKKKKIKLLNGTNSIEISTDGHG